jgi:hypothetical protein
MLDSKKVTASWRSLTSQAAHRLLVEQREKIAAL